MIYNSITIGTTEYSDTKSITVDKSISNFNTTSSFMAKFDNFSGRYSNTFSLNQDVLIKADINNTPTTNIFRGIIEDITFSGQGVNEVLQISGRDYGAILQDIIAEPRIFKDTEVSEIVKSLMRQNVTGISTNNVNVTSTTIDKITFNGMSVFNAIQRLAELSDFFFYVDENKDLNFKQKDAVSSGQVFGEIGISDPVAHYEMNDNAASTTIIDSMGSFNGTAAANTDTMSISGKINNALEFDSSVPDTANLGDTNLLLTDNSAFTICMWVKTSSSSSTEGRFATFQTGTGASTAVNFYRVNNNIGISHRNATAGYTQKVVITDRIDDTWYNLAITYDGTDFKRYVNGVLLYTDTDTFVGFGSGDARLATYDGSSYLLDGAIDDVRVYDSALTADQIESIYNNGNGTEDTNPVYDYNVLKGSFTQSDDDIFNSIKVVGNRQQTAAQQIFTTSVDNVGSVYDLDSKPYNTKVTISGATDTILQPGGVKFINDPSTDDTKFLVDFPSSQITLTSGTTAGDNIQASGTVVIIDYDQSTPLIKTYLDNTSISLYGEKNKEIVDKNINTLAEATDVARAFIEENKDPVTRGDMKIKGVVGVTPGETAVVNLYNQGQSGATYSMIRAKYNFNSINNANDSALDLTVSKKVNSFVDLFTQHELRLRSLETSEVESSITNVEVYTGSVGVSGITQVISTSIGSAFYFNVTGHDILNSPKSLLGPITGGSVVLNI